MRKLIGCRERELILKCLDNDWLTYKSPIVSEFENKFSDYIGESSLFVTSGTAALHLALLSLNVKGEVILPAISFGTTASVVLAIGAKPVYVDTDHRGCLTWNSVAKAITKNTQAIITVHLYGEIADDVTGFGIPVIEDACEALGYRNPNAAFTCYSFFANKDMITGEGGMLIGDVSLARQYRNGGFDENYIFSIPGLNYRPTAFQAALGIAQLEKVNDTQQKRKRACEEYKKYFDGCGTWMFVANLDPNLKIPGTRRVFPLLPHQPAFYQPGHFPNAERFYNHGLCLPTDSIDQARAICQLAHTANYKQP